MLARVSRAFVQEISTKEDAKNRKELELLLRKEMVRRGLLKNCGRRGLCSHSLAMNINKASESTFVKLIEALSYIFLISSSALSILSVIGGILNFVMGVKRGATFFLRVKNFIKGRKTLNYLNDKLKYLTKKLNYDNDIQRLNRHKLAFEKIAINQFSTEKDFKNIQEYWNTFFQKKELQKRLRRHIVFSAIDIAALGGCFCFAFLSGLGVGIPIGAALLGSALILEVAYGIRGKLRQKYRDIAEGISAKKKLDIIKREIDKIKRMTKEPSKEEKKLLKIYESNLNEIVKGNRIRSLFAKLIFDADAITKEDISLQLLNKLLKDKELPLKYKNILMTDNRAELGWPWKFANINKSTQKRILTCKKLSNSVVEKTSQMEPYYFETHPDFKLEHIYDRRTFSPQKIEEVLRKTRERIDNEYANFKPLEASDGSLCSRREEASAVNCRGKREENANVSKVVRSQGKLEDFKTCRDRYMLNFTNKGEMYIS